MGGRYAQSWLFYGWGKNVSRETFSIVTFAFASVFCIGSSNSGVDNTKKFPLFCSTNMDTGISFCPVHFAFCKASPKKEYGSKIASIVGCVSAEKQVKS